MKVAIVTNIVPSYRKAFYEKLANSSDIDIEIFCMSALPKSSLHSLHHQLSVKTRVTPSFSFGKEALVWQALPWTLLTSRYDVVVFLGNPRYLSTLFMATARQWRKRATVLWGQAHTAGANALSEAVRMAWWRMFSFIAVYTDREATELQQRLPKVRSIVGLNNGLDQRAIERAATAWSTSARKDWRKMNGLGDERFVLSCARLEPKNEFPCFFDVFREVLDVCPGVVWCIIGDGPERGRLEEAVAKYGLEKNVRLVGGLYEETELAPWFMEAECLVHPGAIGLTLLHAFGYGLPVVTHDEPSHHMPEFAALRPGHNGLVFRRGSRAALRDSLVSLLTEEQMRSTLGRHARETAESSYNVDVMVARMVTLLRQSLSVSS